MDILNINSLKIAGNTDFNSDPKIKSFSELKEHKKRHKNIRSKQKKNKQRKDQKTPKKKLKGVLLVETH